MGHSELVQTLPSRAGIVTIDKYMGRLRAKLDVIEAELKPTHACHNPNCISRNWPGSKAWGIPELKGQDVNCDYCGEPMEVIK